MDPRVKELFKAIAHLEDPVECARFFRDLCTVTELKAMAERWQVAQLVSEDIPYREISQRTGASTATITRVAPLAEVRGGWIPFYAGAREEAI